MHLRIPAGALPRHRKPHELGPYAQSGVSHFDDLLKNCLPEFHKLCRRQFPSQVLLKDAGNVADLAFLMATWKFSKALGSSGPHVFPCGLHRWPPSPNEIYVAGSGAHSNSGSSAISVTGKPSKPKPYIPLEDDEAPAVPGGLTVMEASASLAPWPYYFSINFVC